MGAWPRRDSVEDGKNTILTLCTLFFWFSLRFSHCKLVMSSAQFVSAPSPRYIQKKQAKKASVSKYFCWLVSYLSWAFCCADGASFLGMICLFLLFFCFLSLFNAYINTTWRVIFIEFLLATVIRSLYFSCNPREREKHSKRQTFQEFCPPFIEIRPFLLCFCGVLTWIAD